MPKKKTEEDLDHVVFGDKSFWSYLDSNQLHHVCETLILTTNHAKTLVQKVDH